MPLIPANPASVIGSYAVTHTRLSRTTLDAESHAYAHTTPGFPSVYAYVNVKHRVREEVANTHAPVSVPC